MAQTFGNDSSHRDSIDREKLCDIHFREDSELWDIGGSFEEVSDLMEELEFKARDVMYPIKEVTEVMQMRACRKYGLNPEALGNEKPSHPVWRELQKMEDEYKLKMLPKQLEGPLKVCGIALEGFWRCPFKDLLLGGRGESSIIVNENTEKELRISSSGIHLVKDHHLIDPLGLLTPSEFYKNFALHRSTLLTKSRELAGILLSACDEGEVAVARNQAAEGEPIYVPYRKRNFLSDINHPLGYAVITGTDKVYSESDNLPEVEGGKFARLRREGEGFYVDGLVDSHKSEVGFCFYRPLLEHEMKNEKSGRSPELAA